MVSAITCAPRCPRRWRSTRTLLVAAIAVAAAATMCGASAARAVILPAVTLDGPSPEIVGFGGVAMAEDGTGGAVYLKRVGGVAHVFVARFIGGRWQQPIQVDRGESFAASWPRIGASDGGQLVVVWATPFATEKEEGAERPVDELLGATLDPGSQEFGEAVIVDPDVGDASALSPDLAMSSTDQADVVYRVVVNGGKVPLLHPGDVDEEVRVAHYLGERWLALGVINRDPGVSMRPPSSTNAPQIAVTNTGNAVVAWQEPELNDNGVARIWARRLFGASVDFVLPVTATTYAGAPILGEADAPSVSLSVLGQAEVAYRQAAGAGSPLPGPRIFLNTLPDGESESGVEFSGAIVADAGVPGGAAAKVGPPSVDVDEQREPRLLYDANGSPRVIEGNDKGLVRALSLGPSFSGPEQPAVSVMDPAGGGVSAWASTEPAGVPAVAVREDFPSGAVQTAFVGGGAGGPIGELAVGRSGLGDGLIAFQQGSIGNAAIVAAEATAPPAQVVLSSPKGWIRASQALVSWAAATSAFGPLTYHVVLDGRELGVRPNASSLRLDPRRLASGRHSVALLATDIDGSATLSPPATLEIDDSPPTVRVRRAGRGRITLRVSDSGSGVATKSVSVSFGDGHGGDARKLFRHRYARAGTYFITVHVADNLGNRALLRVPVSVR